MSLRAIAALVLAIALVFGQLLASAAADDRVDSLTMTASAILTRGVAAQDDNDNSDNDNDDDDDDADDDGDNTDDDLDGDNGDDDGDDDDDDDDDDNDNGDDDDDDSDDNDNGDDDDDDDNDNSAPVRVVTGPTAPDATPTPTRILATATPRPTRTPTPPPARTTEDDAVTNGQDLTVRLTGDRVVVQIFSSMPPGITLKLYLVDPAGFRPTPGGVVGDLMFRIEARDASGAVLSALPAEVNLTVRYQESDLDGRDDAFVTLVRLDPADNQWKPAPRLLPDPATNFVAASIGELGVYAVIAP